MGCDWGYWAFEPRLVDICKCLRALRGEGRRTLLEHLTLSTGLPRLDPTARRSGKNIDEAAHQADYRRDRRRNAGDFSSNVLDCLNGIRIRRRCPLIAGCRHGACHGMDIHAYLQEYKQATSY